MGRSACGHHFAFQRSTLSRLQLQVEDVLKHSSDAVKLAQAPAVVIHCSESFRVELSSVTAPQSPEAAL